MASVEMTTLLMLGNDHDHALKNKIDRRSGRGN